MKKIFLRSSCIALLIMLGTFFCGFNNVSAEDNGENNESPAINTGISITPTSKVLKLEPTTQYDDSFTVTNSGSEEMDFEVYAAPYSYIFSEDDNEYHLGFETETTYTQIVRWITFKDTSGNYVNNPVFKAGPGESVTVNYRINTPSSIPGGGQYAVLFSHTLSAVTLSSGIKTEASAGLVLYGRSNSETISSAEISNLQINQTVNDNGEVKTIINASSRVKNTGNIDFMARGVLQVKGIFGNVYYETPGEQGILSIIPETELAVSDRWEETPYFGLFRVTWTMSAADKTETISRMILLLPTPVIVFLILLLTIIVIWIILMVRKRKERRSRYMV